MSSSLPKRKELSLNSSSESTHIPGPPPRGQGLPRSFGRYRIERPLGQGAMGDVYLADDTQLSRKVALKIPRLDGPDSDERLERFYREARLAATVRNSYLCPVYDVGEIDGVHYIAMAFIEGKPLSELIKSSGRQKERAALILVRKVAMALHEAHSAGIVHRDLKPANIMIDVRGEPVVMDFGLACQADEDRARLTQSGTILGSPAYMSPEQLDGAQKITPASDQFALGVVLYELLTGELPFRGSISAIANQIVNGAPPALRKLRPDLDPRTEQLCLKLLAKKPSDRYASMRDVAQFVATALKTESTPATPEPVDAAPADEAPASSASVQKQVEKLLSWGELVSALEVLETEGIKLTGKPAEWARQKRTEIRTQIEHWKKELPAQCRLGRQLLSKHDYAEAVNILSLVPVAVRDSELTSLLSTAQEKAEEVEQLLKDIERAFRAGTADQLSALVKRFLHLKPGHQRMKALAEDLKRYGPEQVIQKRRKQKDFLDPAGRIWEPTHFLYYAAGLAAACGLLYVATVLLQTPTGSVAIEVLDPTISIDFLQQQVSAGNSGQSFRLKAGEKQMLAVRLGGDLVPDWTQDLSVERNETKRVSARLVDGNVELTINSEKKVFPARRPSDAPANVPKPSPFVASTPPSPVDEWVDLLASVNPRTAGGSITEWAAINGVLTGKVKPGVDIAWVALTPQVDFSGDYDLEVEYLAEGGNYVSVAFPLNETTLGLSISPDGCGLQWIDGKPFKAPEAPTEPRLQPGKLQRLTVAVRHTGPDVAIDALLDGQPAARFAGARSRLEIPKSAVPAPGKLRIVSPIAKPTPTSRLEVRRARYRKASSPPASLVARTDTQPPASSAPLAAQPRDSIIDLDFRKSAEGMSIADQDFSLEEHKDGEFRYLGKKLGWWYAPFNHALWRDENNQLRNFAVEFDIRIPTPKRGEFAIEFGRLGDDTISLCFNQLGQLRLLWAGQELVPPIASPALKPVDQFNTVRMEAEDRTITVALNGARLFQKKLDRLAGRHVAAWLHVDDYPFDVRLQRFRLERLGPREPRQYDGAIRRFEGHSGAIRGIAFLPAGNEALSVANDGALKLWNVSTGQLVHDFPPHPAPVTSLSLSGDGTRALTGCDDGVVRLWDIPGKELVKALKGHTAAVSSVLISKDADIGYSASHDGSIRRWDLKNFSKPTVLPGPGGESTLVYSPDEKLVAASAPDGSIVLRGPKAAGSIIGNDPGPIRGMAFTPDGNKLVAAGSVATVRVWDVSNGKQIHAFDGNDAGFASVAVTSDGKYVVAGCRDFTIRAWNLETGDAVATLRTSLPVTHRLALSPDNTAVLTGGGDGGNREDFSLRLWQLPRH